MTFSGFVQMKMSIFGSGLYGAAQASLFVLANNCTRQDLLDPQGSPEMTSFVRYKNNKLACQFVEVTVALHILNDSVRHNQA